MQFVTTAYRFQKEISKLPEVVQIQLNLKPSESLSGLTVLVEEMFGPKVAKEKTFIYCVLLGIFTQLLTWVPVKEDEAAAVESCSDSGVGSERGGI